MTASRNPVVSIITPTFNQSEFLGETIDSVLAQSYSEIEYIVIDDGSTDETPRILESYGEQIRWICQPNRGQTPTINRGWELATGDILTWLNSDDTLMTDAIDKAVRFLSAHPYASIVYGDTLFTDAVGRPLYRSKGQSGFDYEQFVVECQNPIPQPSAFMRREVIDDVAALDPTYRYFMDWDLWLRAGIRHSIEYIPELLSTYRFHPESKTVSKEAQVAPELSYMYRNYFARSDVPDRIRRQTRKSMANMYFTSGGYCSRGGKPAKSAWMALYALRVYPELLLSARMLHKFLYCLIGTSLMYAGARNFRNNGTGR